MSEELRASRISLLVHVAAGIVIGWISTLIGFALYAVGLALLSVILLGHVTERIVGKRDLKWWASNGLFVFLLVWIDSWIFIFSYF